MWPRLAILAYGLVAYASFHAVFLYLILFLADGPVPYTLESGTQRPVGVAVAIDVALVALFALQHTVMARPAFKRWWTRVIPEPIERSTYVLVTVACLVVLYVCWSPVDGTLWRVASPLPRALLWAFQALGWGVLVWSTFLIDHWELFGVRQVIAHFRGRPLPAKQFRAPALYRYVRHPMMIGILVAFWSTPDMTWSHAVFAAAFTVYTMIGVRIEERDLVAHLGEPYRRYQQTVPRFF